MSDLVKSEISQPTRQEAFSLGMSHTKPDLCENFDLWNRTTEDGVRTIARATFSFSIKKVLETKHPVDNRFKAKDWESLCKEHDSLIEFKEDDFFGKGSYPYRAKVHASVANELQKWFPQFLTAQVRECAVIQHARGKSTVNVIRYLLSPDCETPNVFYHLCDYPTMVKVITEWLTPRLAYLKVGSSSFPKKYQELWQAEREAYLEEIKEIPLRETVEQVQALSDLYSRLDDAFNNAETDRGKAQLASSMVKVMSGLYTLTRDPSLQLPK